MSSEEIIAQVVVTGRANIFCAGLTEVPLDIPEGGDAPQVVSIGPGRQRVVKVAATNVVECINPGEKSGFNRQHGPDGSRYTHAIEVGDQTVKFPVHTNFRTNHGISGIKAAERAMFMVGVFLPREGLEVEPPEGLRFGERPPGSELHDYIPYTFPRLTPKLRQTFFVGDGLIDLNHTDDSCTKPGSGAQQEFVVPRGAGSLYLGFADGNYFGSNNSRDIDQEGGLPGYYDGNYGELVVTLSISGVWGRGDEGDE
jgi:hypothetical protein